MLRGEGCEAWAGEERGVEESLLGAAGLVIPARMGRTLLVPLNGQTGRSTSLAGSRERDVVAGSEGKAAARQPLDF